MNAPWSRGTRAEAVTRSHERPQPEPLPEGVPLLECRGVSKHYGGITAVDSFDLQVYPGEIVALVGDNGAGKSTVIKMLAGAMVPDTGSIHFRGKEVRLTSPKAAQAIGIETVWQTLAIAREMDIASNFFLGRERCYGDQVPLLAPLRSRAMKREAQARLAELGIDVTGKMEMPAGELSGGQIQAIAIARAASWARDILLLDEPTAALGVHQSGIVLDLCRTLRSQGMSLILISHAIPEVLTVADRIVVLRHGRKQFDGQAATIGHEELIGKIVGLDRKAETPTPYTALHHSPGNRGQ
jgi:ABC-type sugar transport system ATPase subunit